MPAEVSQGTYRQAMDSLNNNSSINTSIGQDSNRISSLNSLNSSIGENSVCFVPLRRSIGSKATATSVIAMHTPTAAINAPSVETEQNSSAGSPRNGG